MTDVLILCGGYGTRMAAQYGDAQKCMLPLGGVPVILRVLLNMEARGFLHAVLCVGHRWDVVVGHVSSAVTNRALLKYSIAAPAGVPDAVARGCLVAKGEKVLVVNGDTILNTRDLDLLLTNAPAKLYLGGEHCGAMACLRSDPGSLFDGRWQRIDGDGSFIDCGTPEGYAKAMEIYG